MKKSTGIVSIAILLVLNGLLFKIALDKNLDLVEVPVAKVKIEPRTKIKEEMIETVKMPRVSLNEDCTISKKDIIGKISEIEGIIPKGSMFYTSMLFDESELPDYPALKLKEGQNVFSLASDLMKSSGNSLVNNQKVDIYVTIQQKKENPVTDLLLSSVRILNVLDKKGVDMRVSELNVPSVINLAVNSDDLVLLKKASEMGRIDLFATSYPQEEECKLNEESAILPFLYE